MNTRRSFYGLLYVKHGRIGDSSEGPDYWLQTASGDYLLSYEERDPSESDYHLELHSRHIVEVEGQLDQDAVIRVTRIRVLSVQRIPCDPNAGPRLSEPMRIMPGQRRALADADVKVELIEVVEDSRCPIGATCVWAGQAVVAVEVTVGQAEPERVELTLRPGAAALGAARVGSYMIAIKDLQPHPTIEHVHDPRRYVATLVVTPAGPGERRLPPRR